MSNPTKPPATIVPAKGDEADNDVDVAAVPELPISIMSEILSRLPVDDVARCKSVHKSWYNLSKDPHFTHSHYFTGASSQHHILLWETGGFAFFDPINIGSLYLIRNRDDGKWISFNISAEAVNVMGWVRSSCNGLLCINASHYYSMGPNLVYNPLTKMSTALPELNFHPDYEGGHGYRCAFGFDPVHNKYKVALAYKRKCYVDDTRSWFTLKMSAAIITLGESSWRVLLFPDDLENDILNREPVFFNGAFYWVIGKRFNKEYNGKDETQLDGLLPLDISTENFQIIKFSKSVKIPDSYLEQIQLENSLAFARIKKRDSGGTPSLEIWQIQGANPDGSCLYKDWNFNIYIKGCRFSNDLKGFKLLGAFDNSVFLFKAFQSRTGSEPLHHHLIIFDAKKDEGSVIEMSGAPKSFSASVFPPSFISPTL